jgi:hypothetical protein
MEKMAIIGARRDFVGSSTLFELPPSAKEPVTVELRGQVNKSLKMRQMGR